MTEDQGNTKGRSARESQTSEATGERPKTDYATIIGTAIDGFWITNLQGRILDVNDSSCRMTGYTREELLAMSIPDIEALEKPEETAQHIRKIIEQGYDRFETCHRCKDGNIIQCEISAKYSSFGGGQIVVFARDITERKMAEEALQQAGEWHRALVDTSASAGEAVTVLQDKNGREAVCIFTNDEFARITGYTSEEVLGMTLPDLVPLAMVETLMNRYRSRQRGRPEPARYETALLRKDGQEIPVEVAVGLLDYQGKIATVVYARDITEHRQAEEALRESERRFQRLVENAPDVILRYEFIPQRRYAFISPAVTPITGHTPEEYYADPDLGFKLIHPDDLFLLRSLDRRNLTAGMPETMRWLRKDGTYAWVEQHSIPIYDAEGNLVAVETICRDITQRKQAEEALRESEGRFRRLAENAPDVITRYEFIPKRRHAFISPAITTITGYTPEEYYADPDLGFKLIHPDDLFLLRSLDRRNVTAGMPETMRWLRKDGTYSWAEQHSVPIYDAGGNLVAVEAICRDITQRKQAVELLVTLATSSPIGIYIVQDGKFQYANPLFQELLGYREDELSDMNPLMLVLPEDVKKVRENAVRMLKREQTTPYEFRYVTKDGEIKWVLERVESIDYLGKQATLGNFMDITQRKLMEEDIRRKELEMATERETERLKNQLLSTISHELRTPLASIKGYSTLLLDYNRKLRREQKQESLAAIDKSTDRLTELVDHLLDMSRLEAGLLKLNKVLTDVSGIIQAAVYEANLRAPGYQIGLKLEEVLPKVNIDGRRIRQVLDNLLDNSIKYSQQGSKIMVEAWRDGTKLVVSVADQGIGIPAKEFDKVFDRMYRIEHRMSQDPGGMGLGLALCKALVEGHGGRIWVESEVGKGSTFYFSLPIKTADYANGNGEGR